MIQEKNIMTSDISDSFNNLLTLKSNLEIVSILGIIPPFQKNIENSGKFNEFVFKKLIEDIEAVIDEDKTVTHQQLASEIEKIFEKQNEINKFAEKNNIDPLNIDIRNPISIQSGGKYDLRIEKNTGSSETLKHDTILISLNTKYKEYLSHAARTLVIGPDTKQKDAYTLLKDLMDILISELKPGVAINVAHAHVLE